ncbi:MAG: NADH-quinone oxidoreductase subunit J [Chloroflexi bacterium]|nr:NADH-quinone oxidoreductase subunit J [Chloroflexota bacterium]
MVELNAHTVVFAIFSIITLGGAVGVVWNRNLVSSSYWLIFSLFGVAGLFVLLSAPFLAAVQVLVYIGAVGILITFSVMLTRGMTQIKDVFNRQSAASGVVAVLLFVVLLVGVVLPVWGPSGALSSAPASDVVATTAELGVALVDGSQYVLPFELVSLLLTAALLGAIVIARDQDK